MNHVQTRIDLYVCATNGVIADGEKEVSATGSSPRMPGTLLDASPDPRVGNSGVPTIRDKRQGLHRLDNGDPPADIE